MPLPLAASSLATSSAFTTLSKWGGGVAAVLAIRKWSGGWRLPEELEGEEGQLTGKTYILVGGFSSTGLSLFSLLASRGAQVIALHPTPLSPPILQLLLLLRTSHSNDRLYADACDLSSLASIRTFAARWGKEARAGMMQDLEARIDGIVFCDGEGGGGGEALPFGQGVGYAYQEGGERVERYKMAHLTGRHALVQLLLPSLLRQAQRSTTPTRIINCVSPFYAAVSPKEGELDPKALNYDEREEEGKKKRMFPRRQPWVAMGRVDAASVLLWAEFQRRVSPITAAADDTDLDAKAPSPSPAAAAAADSTAPPPPPPLLALSVSPGLPRSTLTSLLLLPSPFSSFFSLRFFLFLLFYPLIWLFGKTADEAAQGVLGALVGEVEGGRKRGLRGEGGGEGKGEKGGEEERREGMKVRGGRLYREGVEVRVPLFASLSSPAATASAIWEHESKLVERMLVAAIAEEKAEEARKKNAGEAKVEEVVVEEEGRKER